MVVNTWVILQYLDEFYKTSHLEVPLLETRRQLIDPQGQALAGWLAYPASASLVQ